MHSSKRSNLVGLLGDLIGMRMEALRTTRSWTQCTSNGSLEMATQTKSKRRFNRGPDRGWTYPPVRTLKDMSEREIRALEEEYQCPVIRPVDLEATSS